MRRALPLLMSALLSATMLPALAAEATTGPAVSQSVDVRPNDFVVGSWQLYRSLFMTPEGRIVDRENGEISHSESQGYGMLMAEAAGDRDSFSRIWNWTERELQIRDDSLVAWKWDPAANPPVADTNNATDGDLLIAWALLRAHERWDVADYRREAKSIVDDILSQTTEKTRFGMVLLPGATGFSKAERSDGPVVNLSYWIFPAIEELAATFPELKAAKLTASGKAILKAITGTGKSLPSDWTSLAAKTPKPAEGFPPEFGYNAVRIPLYLVWGGTGEPELLGALARPWQSTEGAGPTIIDVATGAAGEPMVGAGYEVIADAVACAGGDGPAGDRLLSFEPSTYYASTLHILTLMALSERYPQCF